MFKPNKKIPRIQESIQLGMTDLCLLISFQFGWGTIWDDAKKHAPSPPSFRSNNSVFKHLPLSPLPVFAPAAFKIQARDPTCLGIQHKPIFLWQTCRGSHQWWVALQTESKWPARPLGLYMCHFKDCYCGFPLQGDLGTNDVEFVGWFHVVFRRHMRHPQKLWFVAGCEHSNLVLFTCDFGNFTFGTGLHLACP